MPKQGGTAIDRYHSSHLCFNGLGIVNGEHLHLLLLVQSVFVDTNYRVCGRKQYLTIGAYLLNIEQPKV